MIGMLPELSANSQFVRCVRYILSGLIVIYVSGLLILGAIGLLAIVRGDIAGASIYAEFIGGLGFIGLLLLTAWYAYHTRRMANQQWKTHKENIEYRRAQREMEVNALRMALKEEIGKIQYLDDLATEYEPGHSTLIPLVPRTVYEANASRLGTLTENEVDLVVEFYTRVEDVEKYMKIQREIDITPPANMLSYVQKLGEGFWNGILKIVTLGHYTLDSERRVNVVKEKLETLAETQEQAVSELEEHINSDSPHKPRNRCV